MIFVFINYILINIRIYGIIKLIGSGIMDNKLHGIAKQMEMEIKINDLNIDKEFEALRQQLFLLGYLDKLDEIIRSEEELYSIINKICLKHNWGEDSEQSLALKGCYINGTHDYDELSYRYENKLIDYNPRDDISGYSIMLNLPDLEEEIKAIVENYPDFDYVMGLYNNQIKQEHENRHK